jgi:hypothetical protein
MISALPDAPLWVAGTLAVATATASWRKFTRGARDLALWLQVPAAVLLYFALFPPMMHLRGDSLTVMTVGALASQQNAAPDDAPLIALPGARAPVKAEPAPDLATALRRHSGVSHLTIIGAGLSARDRPAVAGRSVEFRAAPQQGLLELRAPDTVPLGRQWTLSGRAASDTRRVELRDPSGNIVDKADVDQAGRFVLSGAARGTGTTRFELRLLGDESSVQETISMPLVIVGGTPISVIGRFGALNPELKYWRRWSIDAGLSLSLSATLTDSVNVRAGDARLSAAVLSQADVVVIDARAWAALDASEKSALRAALEQGLGVLLRADAALTPETMADWRDFGFTLLTATGPTVVTLDQYMGLRDHTAFTAAAVSVSAPTSVVQLKADDGTPLAWWHAQGRGRIALWRLLDSYRLALLGEPDRYASLWASTLELLARPRAPSPPVPQLPQNSWVLERTVFCDLGSVASVRAPHGESVGLTVGADRCAAFWPAASGWYTLQTAGSEWPFYVRALDDGRTLHAALDAAATAALVTDVPDAARVGTLIGAPAAPLRAPMASWPWLGAWLAVSAVSWWWERRGYAQR